MIRVKPFRGLRPKPEYIDQVASPPYDVLSSEEAREKAKDRPFSFLHVVKPEIDLDPSLETTHPDVYAKGAENLRRLVERGILARDEKSCFYVYKLRMGAHEQVGLMAGAAVDDYEQNRIKKHEFTRPSKEQDRVNHVDRLNAQTGPVFLTYNAQPEIDVLMSRIIEQEPVYDFVGDYDVRHLLYVVSDEDTIRSIREAFEKVDALYVADGHHRSAAATRVRELRKKENTAHTGEESYNYFLSVIFPDNQMQILDYNRTAADLNGLTTEDFISGVSETFTVRPCRSSGIPEPYRPERAHSFGMYLGGQWYKLTAGEESFDAGNPIASLDVSILQENLLDPVLGITDPRTDERIAFVGGIRGLEELEKRVDGGKAAVAFALYPTSISQLMAVADAGKVMPPKSTWFEPKLRSGVVVYVLD